MNGNEGINPDPLASAVEQVAAENAAASAASATNELQSEIAKLRGEVLEANDRALRATAELENFRKRARRELEDEKRYAAMPLLRDLLNVLDNLDRAITSVPESELLPESTDRLLQGVELVREQFLAKLESYGVSRLPSLGTQRAAVATTLPSTTTCRPGPNLYRSPCLSQRTLTR